MTKNYQEGFALIQVLITTVLIGMLFALSFNFTQKLLRLTQPLKKQLQIKKIKDETKTTCTILFASEKTYLCKKGTIQWHVIN
jgi:Tfp pilus assembly protein PilV